MNEIDRIYKTHKATVTNSHGYMLNNNKIVPKNTVLMFLANPGYCASRQLVRLVSHNHFLTKNKLNKFMRSNVPNNQIYVSNIFKKRTHLPNTPYKNMQLYYGNKLKSFAYTKKLPLLSKQHIQKNYFYENKAPKFAETVGPIKRGTSIKLSNLLKQIGPGVHIIGSCRESIENMNKTDSESSLDVPNYGWPHLIAQHPSNPNLRRPNNTLTAKHPGLYNYYLNSERKNSLPPNIQKITDKKEINVLSLCPLK